jgi:hypothetical protein
VRDDPRAGRRQLLTQLLDDLWIRLKERRLCLRKRATRFVAIGSNQQ